MNRPALRLVGALLALVAAATVLAVTVAGLVGLVVALVPTEPWSQGRIVAASMTVAGLALLVVAHILDDQALPRAGAHIQAVSAGLVATVASRGRR